MHKYLRYSLIASVLLAAYAAAMVIYVVPYAWLIPVGLGVAMLYRQTARYTAYGTARWTEASDIPHMLEGNGLILGHIEGKPSKLAAIMALFDSKIPDWQACQKCLAAFQRVQPKYLVRLTRAIHTAIFAPTGVGKGVSCIIPFLRRNRESAVVNDLKGENYKLTAGTRRQMGHRVICLDPFHIVGGRDTFNALQFIDKDSPTALDDCRDLAAALVVRTGEEREPHWNDSAEIWITAMIACVVCLANDHEKNLQFVRLLLTDPVKMRSAIKLMRESTMWNGMLARLGHQLGHYVHRELGSVLTNANRHLRFLDTLAVEESTTQSSFDPAELLTGQMTVYLVMPPEHMKAQTGLLRLWIGSMLRAVVKDGLQEKTKVHFVLDEAGSLGHLECLDSAVNILRGYGARFQFYYQSLGQLHECWPKGQEQTLLSNVTQVFFGVNDPQTAEYVSNRLGEETIIVESGGTSSSWSRSGSRHGEGGSNSYSASESHNWQQIGRKLLKPEEVAGLHERVAITFTPGVPPIWTRLIRYYEGFGDPPGLSPQKMVFDAACLLVATSVLAVMFTAAIFNHTFQ